MEMRVVKKWLTFFCGILAAIMIADQLSAIIVSAAGITGLGKFVLSFILFAALFFAVLYAIERIAGIRFFGLDRDT
jgi:uncharacterized protein HemY